MQAEESEKEKERFEADEKKKLLKLRMRLYCARVGYIFNSSVTFTIVNCALISPFRVLYCII